jgi:hypothetical protein
LPPLGGATSAVIRNSPAIAACRKLVTIAPRKYTLDNRDRL